MESLTGRTAFITGGASGIGLGMARAFLGAGMRVVIADLRPAAISDALASLAGGNRVHAIQLDVTNRPAMSAAADEAERVFGPVHLLCNNAGVGMLGALESMTYDDWDWCFAVNLGGVINGIQTFLPRMLTHRQGGHIVNTSSIGALSPGPGGAAYLSAKAAVIVLSECLKIELAEHGIGVTVLIPGPTRTEINRVRELRPERFQNTGLREVEERLAQHPLFEGGLDPQAVGALVLEAVSRNDLFALTHNEFKEGVAQRCEAILSSFPRGPIDHERAASFGFPLVNPMYTEIQRRNAMRVDPARHEES